MWRYCPFTPFGPVVEAPNPTAFLPVSPIEMLRKKKLHGNVPWLVGMVEKEGLYPGAGLKNYIPNYTFLFLKIVQILYFVYRDYRNHS